MLTTTDFILPSELLCLLHKIEWVLDAVTQWEIENLIIATSNFLCNP